MSTIFNIPQGLKGKTIVPQTGDLDMSVRFGIWKNYESWLDSSEVSDLWHDLEILQTNSVNLSVCINCVEIFSHEFSTLETVNIHHKFDDADPSEFDLEIKISDLNNVPIRDDTGIFVSGMVEIESIKLQGIEVRHLIENTMLGNDARLSFKASTPIYSWLVKNQPIVLPKQFNSMLSSS